MLSTAVITADISFAATTDPEKNLITNSSFEDNSNWSLGGLLRTTEKAHTGSYSAKCSARGQSVMVATAQNIRIEKNTDYVLSGYVYRGDNSTWAYIDLNDITGEVQLLDITSYGRWKYVSAVWNSGNYDNVTVRMVVEPNYTINQHLGAGITGDVWFDDITFTPVTYDSYSETPPTLSSSAKSYTLENDDIKVSVVSGQSKEYLTQITNKNNGYNWINKATEIPLLNEYQSGDISWTLSGTEVDNTKALKGTGKNACHTITFKYNSNISGLTLNSYWKIYPTGPIYHYSEIKNNTGREIKFDSSQITAGDILLSIPNDVTVHSFNRSRYNNGMDGNFTTGVFKNKVTTDMFFKSTVENSWLVSSGSLPFELLQGSDHGLYVGYEWSYGNMLMRTQSDKTKLRFTADLGASSDVITRENGDTLLVPPVFYGAYSGTVDDGSNNMKEWFYNHLMTESLRENENEPLIEFHVPVFSENDLRNYLNTYDLEEYGIELTKMDYWWTVPGSSFDATLEQQWNPDSSKWPNGMTYGNLVKKHYPSLKTSLYMCDTYNGVDIGTKEGQQAQIKALTERMNNWNIDYWRSDFDLLKPNNYANHEGLMKILDTMIANDEDFRYEHCSAGGSLKDFSTLQRMTFMTMEDSGGALNHRMAFYSNSYMINPVQLKFDMGFDWTSDADSWYIGNNREKWITYNVRTAMLGAMMVQNVGSWLNDLEKRELIKGWELYKTKQRQILRGANVYHILPMPDGKNWDGMQFYNDEIEKGSVFLFRDKNLGGTDGSSKKIKLQGLDENSSYTLTFQDRSAQNITMTGKQLMESGITVTGMTSVYDSEIIWIEKTGGTIPTEPEQETTEQITEPQNEVLVGDADGNGRISISDATTIQQHIVESVTLTGNLAIAADVNKDGIVNIKDATAIQFYLVDDLEQAYYCGTYIGGSNPTVPTMTTPNPTTPANDTTIYFKAGHWTEANAWFSVYAWNDSTGEKTFVKMTEASTGVYSADLGAKYPNVIFCRNDPAKTAVDWSSAWNQTADLTVQSGCNKFTVNSGEWTGANGTWSTY